MALFVAGVSLNTTEGELREIFQQYGKIIDGVLADDLVDPVNSRDVIIATNSAILQRNAHIYVSCSKPTTTADAAAITDHEAEVPVQAEAEANREAEAGTAIIEGISTITAAVTVTEGIIIIIMEEGTINIIIQQSTAGARVQVLVRVRVNLRVRVNIEVRVKVEVRVNLRIKVKAEVNLRVEVGLRAKVVIDDVLTLLIVNMQGEI
ncbi:MAG: hypothetical protein EZS28_022302 [Streblomastix strix]|uniref:RRM domain-containing protein n=1 Tax=Streblomastix strix TaxID=222440 RepID=A0A5J4VHU6_9EUKA|nr:MAG: hypothetical protein EZS28_022302 [Streblomastix strix]